MDFRILGPLEVLDEGRRVALGGSKQRALLAVLLVHANEVISTERLIDELWGEHPPATAAKTVQVHVSRLRKALGGRASNGSRGVVVTRDHGYELKVDPECLDSHRFERLAAEGRTAMAADRPEAAVSMLEAALSLWRGTPLADLAYEPFAQREIARLDDLRVAAVEQLIDAKLALGRHTEVVGQLEALIGEHPYRERLRAQLMLALYRSERQADALQAYQAARQTLVGELGIEPGERLRELERAILAQDTELQLAGAEEPTADTSGSTLAGRDRELAELVDGLDDVLAGRARLFLVGGEPGIGKSRLAEELITRARARGLRILVGRCWEAGGAPAYWPWVQSFRAYVRESDVADLRAQLGTAGPELTTILPELRELLPDLPAGQESDSEGARFRLFESLAAFLREAASSQPLAVFLDDLHAADAPSLLLLRFVVAELADAPILIVGCYRDTEVGRDLAETLAELSRQAAVHRLALKGLGGSDTSRLLEMTMGEAPTDELAERVHLETQGNPLFAAEIGRLLASEGGREPTKGRLPLPEGVREAIALRLQRQSEMCREVLTLASVIGREFGLDVLQRASVLQEDQVLGALEEAAAARLVGNTPGASERLRFSHILVRDALYMDLPAPRRLGLHRAIAERLEALYVRNPDPHLAELAHHYLQAGSAVAEKAIEYAHRAGDRAASQHGYEEAVRHYTSALHVLETTGSGDDHRSCELLLSLGDVLSRAGSGPEAKDALRRAASIAEQAGRSDQLARAALQYGGRFAWARASTDPALVPLLERALAAIGDQDSLTRVKLLARLAGALRDEPFRGRRVALAEEALDIARRGADPVTLAFALEGHWIAVEGPELLARSEGIPMGTELIHLGEQIGDRERVFAGHDHLLHCYWILADRAAVDVELDALIALADELRQPAQRWHVGTGRTMLALMEGRFEQAERLISETLFAGQQVQSWNALVSQRLALFVLRREQGRLAEIEDTIRRSVHEYPALLRFRCALANLYGELGRPQDTRAVLDVLLSRDLAQEHRDAEWLFSISLLVDPCALLGDEGAAERLYSLLLPYEHMYAQAPVEAVFGSLARGLGVLATTLRHFEDAERHFDVALETERKMRAHPWLAHVQHDLAAMLLARGGTADAERAGSLLGEAVNAYGDLGMETWASRAVALGRGARG